MNPLKTLQPVVPKGGHVYSQSINLNFQSYIDLSESQSSKGDTAFGKSPGLNLVNHQYGLLKKK